MKIELRKIVEPLLAWYGKNARKLPWRDDPSPYRVWVSEIMLQQTRVGAVKPYFDRFMRELPSLHALANTPEQQLLKLWEGLGYYNRVRNLQKAAIIVEEQYGGKLPNSYGELQKLPGIGSYTAGAITSIAFGLPHPAVDGNVLRVLSRLQADRSDILQGSVKKKAEAGLAEIMPAGKTSDFTQAMMELGALVCLPNGKPLCEECPLCGLCIAYQKGVQGELPVKKPKAKRRRVKRTVLVITEGNKLAIRKRVEKGLLAGMWELPALDGHRSEAEVLTWLMEHGICAREVRQLRAAKHIFTHVEWLMQGYFVLADDTMADGFTWVSRKQVLEEYAIPTTFSAYLKCFMDGIQDG